MAGKLKHYPDIALIPDNLTVPVDFDDVFGRSAPLHLEIGAGKGTFLLNQAKAQPDIDFLGIEWANKYYRHAVDRIGRWQLKNVRIVRTDAAAFITDFLAADSVDAFHIYFPDPWPKKRHHKRRFISPDNLSRMLKCLKTAGSIRIATDHADYFQQIQEIIRSCEDRLKKIDFLPTAGAEKGEYVGTNYERKYIKEDRDVFTIAVRKIK